MVARTGEARVDAADFAQDTGKEDELGAIADRNATTAIPLTSRSA